MSEGDKLLSLLLGMGSYQLCPRSRVQGSDLELKEMLIDSRSLQPPGLRGISTMMSKCLEVKGRKTPTPADQGEDRASWGPE